MNNIAGAGSILRILGDQHIRMRALLHQMADGTGPEKQIAFDALRRLMAVHQAAEDFVLRPAAQSVISRPIVRTRIEEERRIGEMLEDLERLDPEGRAFQEALFTFTEALAMHMWFEEAEEWLPLEICWSDNEQVRLGAWLYRAFGPDPANPMAHASTPHRVPCPEFRALFQDAVDRLAVSRTRDAPSRYFEAVSVALAS